MKKSILFITFFLLFCPQFYSQTEGIGVGLVFGEPFGLDVKRWIDKNNAIEVAIAYSVAIQHNRFTFHTDYLWHSLNSIKSRESFAIHYGIGLRYSVQTDESDRHGIRFIYGLMWYPKQKYPVDFFLELAPVMLFYPYIGLNIDAGAGLRYYFKTGDEP